MAKITEQPTTLPDAAHGLAAEALAQRVHGRVEPGGELVYEVNRRNPFAFFGGLGA